MASEPLPQLLMRLESLAGLAPAVPPEGYTLRIATPADLPALSRCLATAFPEMEWSEEKTRERLFDDQSVKTVFVAEAPDQTLAATASARFKREEFPDAGYLHWVGADPAHAGRGLGKLVTLAVLHEFVELGFSEAVLKTDDFRLPAIRLYEKLGFVPQLTHPSFAARWAALQNA